MLVLFAQNTSRENGKKKKKKKKIRERIELARVVERKKKRKKYVLARETSVKRNLIRDVTSSLSRKLPPRRYCLVDKDNEAGQ